jgi:two-component sensor histidine kinase
MKVLKWIVWGVLLLAGPSLWSMPDNPWQQLEEARQLVKKGEHTQARILLESVRKRFSSQNSDQGLGKTFMLWGESLIATRQYDSTLVVYAEAAKFCSKAEMHQEASYAYSVLGEINRLRGQHKVSLINNLRSAHHTQLVNNPSQYSSRLSLIGTNYKELNQPDSAEWYFLQAIAIKEEIQDSVLLPIAYENIANFFSNQGLTGKSVEYYLKAIEWAGYLQQDIKIANALSNLSHTLSDAGQYQKAKGYAEQALLMFDTLELYFYKANVLSALAQIADKEDEVEKALQYHEEALRIYLDVENDPKILDQQINMASFFVKQQQYEQAWEFLQKGYQLADKMENQGDLLSLMLIEGTILERRKLPGQSIAIFRKAEAMAKDQQNLSAYERALTGISRSAVATGDYALAYEYLEKSKVINDSINQLEQNRYAQQLEAQYQRSKQEEAITKLSYENALYDLQLQSSRRKIISWITLCLIALGAAFTGFFFFNLKRKMSVTLLEKNKIIEKALAEKDLLLREIHHRVKNNLQVISSLLKLQSRYIKDPKAIRAINEGRTRVRSMALIHQNLYQKENLTGVRVQQYFSKLLEELFATYRIDEEQIRLNTEIEDLNLDVDTIVPIGLILNELVTNSLKYAFPENASGQLNIRLQETQGELVLEVADTGKGMEDMNVLEHPRSFGYRLIKALGEKLEATIELDNQKGTKVLLRIKDYKRGSLATAPV